MRRRRGRRGRRRRRRRRRRRGIKRLKGKDLGKSRKREKWTGRWREYNTEEEGEA